MAIFPLNKLKDCIIQESSSIGLVLVSEGADNDLKEEHSPTLDPSYRAVPSNRHTSILNFGASSTSAGP